MNVAIVEEIHKRLVSHVQETNSKIGKFVETAIVEKISRETHDINGIFEQETLVEAALKFGKKNLVFTDDCVDYNKEQYAGFLAGARWLFDIQKQKANNLRETI